MMERP